MRTAAARKAAVSAKPIHRPGLARKLPGLKWVIESMGEVPGGVPAAAPPLKRCISISPKYEVLKAIFSTAPMASSGNAAHRNAARRAQAETSNNHPNIGAYHSP